MKTNIIIIAGMGILVVLLAGYFFLTNSSNYTATNTPPESNQDSMPVEPDGGIGDGAEPLEEETFDPDTQIGTSANDNDIMAYHYGTGDKEVVFVGGIHGGYSWNTALVAYQLMDYLEDNPDAIPENVRVTVIPVLNPDGLYEVVGTTARFEASDVTLALEDTIPGRFNGNDVDLNRNFDCDWQASGTWQSRTVSGGSAAFSEPEAKALKEYVESTDPVAVVAWYSSAGGVYSSSCHNGVSAETSALTNLYADASGYTAYEEFDFYEITGDMMNWLAKEGYPAISVLLTTHTDTEWVKNRNGIEAVLEYYAE